MTSVRNSSSCFLAVIMLVATSIKRSTNY